MILFGIWKADVDLDDLADAPRWFLEGVLRGEPEEVAAQKAGVTLEEVRHWSGDRKFRVLLKRARRAEGRATMITATPRSEPAPLLDADATYSVDETGIVQSHSNTTPRFVTPPPANTVSLPAGQWGEYDVRTCAGEPADEVLEELRERARQQTEQPSAGGLFYIERGTQ